MSSLSSLERKKSDSGWFFGVLGGDSGYGDSHQLKLFEEKIMVVHEGMRPVGKLDL